MGHNSKGMHDVLPTHLQFLHLPLQSKAIDYVHADGHGAEVILGGAEPLGEGAEDALSFFN